MIQLLPNKKNCYLTFCVIFYTIKYPMKHFSCIHLNQAGSTISIDLKNKNNKCGVTITLKIILNPYVSLFFNNLKFRNSCLIFFFNALLTNHTFLSSPFLLFYVFFDLYVTCVIARLVQKF